MSGVRWRAAQARTWTPANISQEGGQVLTGSKTFTINIMSVDVCSHVSKYVRASLYYHHYYKGHCYHHDL